VIDNVSNNLGVVEHDEQHGDKVSEDEDKEYEQFILYCVGQIIERAAR
jgi:hypothetical protein